MITFFVALLLPIDKLIGRIYPIFGIVLILMMIGVGGGIILGGTYILMADEGFRLSGQIAYPAGIGVTVLCFGIFFVRVYQKKDY